MAGNEVPLAIGIDIGSTKIVLAVCKKEQNAQIILDHEENRSTPFCVAFTEKQRLISYTAQYQATSNSLNTIFGKGNNLFFSFDNIIYLQIIIELEIVMQNLQFQLSFNPLIKYWT